MKILAIDPGPKQSAFVKYEDGRVLMSGKNDNAFVLAEIGATICDCVVIEMIAHYGTGMPAGAEIFETCVWIGKFEREAEIRQSNTKYSPVSGQRIEDVFAIARVFRREVKSHLCGSQEAKDPNIRQALIDRFGGKEKAIGKKNAPGPLYDIKGDEWSALAVAVTFAEMHSR